MCVLEGEGAVDTTEKGLSCVWVGARNSVHFVLCVCVCVSMTEVWSCVFVNMRKCFYLYSFACAVGQ